MKRITEKGYVKVRRSAQEPWRYEHRLRVEEHIGEIPPGMEVHHIDFNRANNALENLALLSKGDHISLHHHERVGNLQTVALLTEKGRQAIEQARARLLALNQQAARRCLYGRKTVLRKRSKQESDFQSQRGLRDRPAVKPNRRW